MARLLEVDPADWRKELPAIHQHFARFGDRLPAALREQLADLERRLESP
jgi:phosphoenolpyruvate carboxykinase (GTP)